MAKEGKDLQRQSIRDWPTSERPRERLVAQGAGSLSDAELLAIFIGSGVKGASALDIARNALNHHGGIRQLLNLSHADFCALKGMGTTKYVLLRAALELGKRFLDQELIRGEALCSTKASRDYLKICLRDKRFECFFALFLDTQHRVIKAKELFRGTIDSAVVPIREVVVEALEHNAAAMIVAHNHPSGVSEPSMADKTLTANLKAALNLVGVRLLDHFVVGDAEITSFAELGLLDEF